VINNLSYKCQKSKINLNKKIKANFMIIWKFHNRKILYNFQRNLCMIIVRLYLWLRILMKQKLGNKMMNFKIQKRVQGLIPMIYLEIINYSLQLLNWKESLSSNKKLALEFLNALKAKIWMLLKTQRRNWTLKKKKKKRKVKFYKQV
jgi:hypothetical protein